MDAWLYQFTTLQKFYFFFAAIGLVLFIASFGLSVFGICESDGEHLGGEFSWFSLHAITSFFLMSGLLGLTLNKQFALPGLVSLAGATLGGIFCALVLRKLNRLAKSLRSNGTIDLSSAILETGTVYLTIPKHGAGKVRVVVSGRLKVIDAVGSQEIAIKTGVKIKVVGVLPDGYLQVEPLI